mmetsp:Transcript_14366/g.46964  ORF Transcript_14366/g.46964 Transcript_14366/m.46964 type:complete len:237 (+) Transcript_14366:549-1259(+)
MGEGERAPSRSSGSMAAKRASPSAESTSARPCAAPDRSTADVSCESPSRSHGTSCGKCSSPRPTQRRPRARAPVERTSGIGSISTACSCGRSIGMYGTMSEASARSEHMEPVMWAVRRLACADGALSPRCNTGTMSDRLGASTQCSNWQWARADSAASVAVAGSRRADRRAGTISAISGLRMTEPTEPSAKPAASRTFACEWVSAVVSAGTSCGNVAESCFWLTKAIDPISSTAAC